MTENIVTKSRKRFLEKYPLDLVEIFATPTVFRENIPEMQELPHPSTALVRDLAEFAGYSYGAFRTAVSRARAKKECDTFTDEKGITRFRFTPIQQSINNTASLRQSTESDGFFVAILDFEPGIESKRQAAKEILSWFGFVPFSKNAFISGRFDTEVLDAELEKLGILGNVFLFPAEASGSPAFSRKLLSAFDLPTLAEKLHEFSTDTKDFLLCPGMDSLEIGRRVMYSGPISHKLFFHQVPVLPKAWLPADYPLSEVRTSFYALINGRVNDLISYYRNFSA